MSAAYPILDVTDWPAAGDEAMGSKPKVWLSAPDQARWLFKERHRAHTGDDWAEKLAAEVAAVLGIPHATVELARRDGKRGIVTRDLVVELAAQELVLGNSLLVEADPAYPTVNRYHVAEHTAGRVHAALAQPFIGLPATCPPAPELRTAPDLFTGYLLLDALLGNTDRHHENWAILLMRPTAAGPAAVLCPSFDHASCLGHNIRDEERADRLTTRVVNRRVAAYVRSSKVRSALYDAPTDPKPLSPAGAFREFGRRCPAAARFWLDRLAATPADRITDLVTGAPAEIMSDVSKRFAREMLVENRRTLLNEPP